MNGSTDNSQQQQQHITPTAATVQLSPLLSNKWFVEPINADLLHVSSLKSVEYTGRTKFQQMDIVELGSFGRTLVLDNLVQSCECDEMTYHEALVHPSMLAHGSGSGGSGPKRVFVGGGGEGATIREILKHESVEECIMVDIDGVCVDMCKKYLTKHHAGAFDDPRLTLVIDDAMVALQSAADESFDVIVLDLADPMDGGPCYQLYTDWFYELCKQKLTPGGVVVTQSGPCSLLSHTDVFTPVHHTLRTVFGQENTFGYASNVPSFVEDYGFNMAIKQDPTGAVRTVSPVAMSVQEIDDRIAQRIRNGEKNLGYYDGITHQRLFSMIKPIRISMREENRLISKDNYVFMVNNAATSQQPPMFF